MTISHTRALAGLAGAALVVSLAPMGAQAAEAPPVDGKSASVKRDELPNPKAEAQRELRESAVQSLINGKASV